jgi:two-component system sensor histidine kinase MprB
MSFRTRTVLAVAAAVSVAIVAAAGAAYVAARNQLVSQVNAGLRDQADSLARMDPERILGYRGGVFNTYYQVVAADGRMQRPPGERYGIPIGDDTKQVASGTRKPFFSEARVGGLPARVYTFHYADGIAIQVAGDVSDIKRALARLRWILIVVGGAGILVATLIALFVARHVLRPVRSRTEARE